MVDMVVKLKYEVPPLAKLLIISIPSTPIRMKVSHRTRASLCRTGPAVTVLHKAANSTGTVNIIFARISLGWNDVGKRGMIRLNKSALVQ